MREDAYQWIALCNLIATATWISLNFNTSHAIGRPIHLAFCALLLTGLGWAALARWGRLKEDEFPVRHWIFEPNKYKRGDQARALAWKHLGSLLHLLGIRDTPSLILTVCVILRILFLRSIVLNVQCSRSGVEIFLPLVLSIFDLYPQHTGDSRELPNQFIQPYSAYARLYTFRYVYLVAFWITSATSILSLSEQHSTYICPSGVNFIPLIQILGLFLDAGIIIVVSRMVDALDLSKSWKSLSGVSFASAKVLTPVTLLFLLINHRHITWAIILDCNTVLDLLFTSLLVASFVSSVVLLMGELRPTTIFTVVGCITVYTSALQNELFDMGRRSGLFVLFSLITITTLFGIAQLDKAVSSSQKGSYLTQASSTILMSLCMLIFMATFYSTNFVRHNISNIWSTHPINVLISEARPASERWGNQAGASKTLEQAIVEYQRRYNIPPPPQFDKWWDFSISRGSVILDDFTQIHDDLEPFWGLKPALIRRMTADLVERPWAGVAGLRISNGTVHIGRHMPPTHRWMMEGAAGIVNNFAKWLPDMDLGFNLDDESRVVVPWNDMQDLLSAASLAKQAVTGTQNSFSANAWRGKFMDELPPYSNNLPLKYLYQRSFKPSFEEFGSITCSRDSAARKWKWWNKKAFCRRCTTPHSLGPFIRDWKLYGSLCHQPDVANLHGFYLSPSTFKASKTLLPIFSQSKISTFSDILFPSPWNYLGKVIYDEKTDVDFSEKDNTLLWRGRTSEGFSIDNTWEGMQRQRLIHLVDHTSPHSTTPIILPNFLHGGIYEAKPIRLSTILSETNISISFVPEVTRCEVADCTAQIREFGFAPPIDFQAHWKYKYLIDLDGAGFSGRFLPFLQSRSLVFRVASFRQWFDERLTAWVHFVPVDGRFHGFWDLVAYFGGVEGVNGHEAEAEDIAGSGREWANKVLRKEDMEVYMFRLLLEWGRVVDDRRSELGFTINDIDPGKKPNEI